MGSANPKTVEIRNSVMKKFELGNSMTWIVGATAFNGLVCVADVQATFEYLDRTRPPKYYNCVRKLHKTHENLYIGFSGDIKSGLLMIERLKDLMAVAYAENELFDIEGQLAKLQKYLADLYREINPSTSPTLELMFFWMKQEGESVFFEPACMRFIAPTFGNSGIGMLQINQSGSGKRSPEFQALVDFLTGVPPQEDLARKLFSGISSAPTIWTASKIRTLLINEGQNITFAGVSKSFLSVIAETGWNQTVSPSTHKKLISALEEIGVERRQEKTLSDTLHITEVNPVKISKKIAELAESNPKKLSQIGEMLRAYKLEENIEPLTRLPEFKENLHVGGGEQVSIEKLCSTWKDMELFMGQQGIILGDCTARA